MPKAALPTVDAANGYADWIAGYRARLAAQDAASWALADWLADARRLGMAVTSSAMSDELDVSRVKLCDLVRVADAFPPADRRAALPFDVHAHLAKMPPEERAASLSRAAVEEWGERSAKRAAAEYRQEQAGFQDEDQETSQAVIIMRAWNRASPEAREYFNELRELAGLGLVHEEVAIG